MQKVSEVYKDGDVVVLAVNSGDSVERIKEYFEKEKFTFRPVRQKENEIADAYGVGAYPTNYVIGKDGKVAFRTVGFDEEKLKETLEELAPRK